MKEGVLELPKAYLKIIGFIVEALKRQVKSNPYNTKKTLYYFLPVHLNDVYMLGRFCQAFLSMNITSEQKDEMITIIKPWHAQLPRETPFPKCPKGKNHIAWINQLKAAAREYKAGASKLSQHTLRKYDLNLELELFNLRQIYLFSKSNEFKMDRRHLLGVRRYLNFKPPSTKAYQALFAIVNDIYPGFSR
jgi:hypothetical protein